MSIHGVRVTFISRGLVRYNIISRDEHMRTEYQIVLGYFEAKCYARIGFWKLLARPGVNYSNPNVRVVILRCISLILPSDVL